MITVKDNAHTRSLRVDLFKTFKYNGNSERVMADMFRNSKFNWYYKEIEDNNNPGNPYQSLDDFWNWLITSINNIT